eukprot:9148962-Alexandrium_andersonii.AAC.1
MPFQLRDLASQVKPKACEKSALGSLLHDQDEGRRGPAVPLVGETVASQAAQVAAPPPAEGVAMELEAE